MSLKPFILWFFSLTALAQGSNFQKAIKNLNNHPAVQVLDQKSGALLEKSNSVEAWDDPILKSMAKNIPINSFSLDETPMTGFEVSISQKIPTSNVRNVASSALREKSNALLWEKKDQVRKMQVKAWKLAIDWHKNQKEASVLYKSKRWLQKKLEVSHTLYKNGTISQQAIMELEKRKASIQREIENRKFLQQRITIQLEYMFSQGPKVEISQVPLTLISRIEPSRSIVNAKESSLQFAARSATLDRQAKGLAETPDITVGLGYTFRSKLDKKGDFIGLSVGIPLPVTNTQTSKTLAAQHTEKAAIKLHQDYRSKRVNLVKQLEIEKERISRERQILTHKSIKYARLARDIVAKSYGIGNATYTELLGTELSLEDLKLKEIKYWAELLNTKLTLKYLRGEKLW